MKIMGTLIRGSLNNEPYEGNDVCWKNGPALIGDEAIGKGGEHGPQREDRNHPTLKARVIGQVENTLACDRLAVT